MSGKSEFFENILKSVSKATGETVDDLRKLPSTEVEKLHDEFIVGGALKERAAKAPQTPAQPAQEPGLFNQLKEKGYALPKEEPNFSSANAVEGYAAQAGKPELPKLDLPKESAPLPSESDADYVKRVNKMPMSAKIGGAAALGGAGYGAYKLKGGKADEAGATPQSAQSPSTPIGAAALPDKGFKALKRGMEMSPSKLKPIDVDAMYQDIVKQMPDIPAPDRKEYNEARQAIAAQIESAKQLYADKTNRAEWAEVAETIGQALVQLGAAAQGLQTGVDLSGIKFNKADWKSKIDRYGAELDRSLKGLSAESESVAKREEDTVRGAERKQEKLGGLREQLLKAKVGEKEKLRDLEEEGRQKDANRKNQLEIANIGAESRETVADKRNAGRTNQQGAAQETFISTLGQLNNLPQSKRESVMKELPALAAKAGYKNEELQQLLKTADDAQVLGSDFSKAAEAARGMKPVAQPAQSAQAGQQPPAMPKIGEERNGYRFKGGNPASPEAWEKI